MATWLYAFLFPNYGDELNSEGLDLVLNNNDIELRDEIAPFELTEEGFFISAYDRSIRVENNNFDKIRKEFVQKKANFQIEFTGKEIYGVFSWLNYSKQENYNPHAIISFPQKSYYEKVLETNKHDLYRFKLIDVAKKLNASYILFTEEAAEDFQNCFLEREDGVRLLDASLLLRNPWPYVVSEIWIDYSKGARTPIGFPLHDKIALGKGFFKHHANYTAMNSKRWCVLCGYKTII